MVGTAFETFRLDRLGSVQGPSLARTKEALTGIR